MAPKDPKEPHVLIDEDREAILARRRALIRRAMGTLGAAVLVGAAVDCTDSVGPGNGNDAAMRSDVVDAGPQPCLSPEMPDSGVDAAPMPCLEPWVPDAGPDADDAGDDVFDAGPQPCLSPPPPDAGEDAEPTPCLRVAPDAD